MKKLQILILLLISLNITAFAHYPQSGIRITRVAMGGNFVSYMTIAPDKNSLKKLISIEPYFQTINRYNFIVKLSAIKYIEKYLIEHCDTVNRINDTTSDYFVIDVFSSKEHYRCYLVDQKNSKPYFISWKNWIEKSIYKNECRKVIKGLEPYMR